MIEELPALDTLPDLGIWGWALLGAFAFFTLLLLIIVAYFFLKRGSGSVNFEKKLIDGHSVVSVQPFFNLKRAMVQDKAGGESLVFVRENIPSGEKVVFEYPASNTPARLTTEGEISVTLEAKP
ncbi:hypothetical protein JW721_05150 [Candidatus Micrarchaeota archaeon]|nr:hypothetical protein [Candidatus Micrarchaeota archaeon]